MDQNEERFTATGVTGHLEHETERAYLLDVGVPAGKIWIPKSQATDVTKLEDGNFFMEIPLWLAQEKGLI